MGGGEAGRMDKPSFPPSGAGRLSLAAAGEAWSWRLTTPSGECIAGLAPDPAAARRSAAFAAGAVQALQRTRRRWF
jgi:hypothetical protein